MKRLITVALLLSFTAFAGERLICIVSAINATKSTADQNPDGGANAYDGGIYQPCYIPPMDLLTVQCTDDMYVCTDKATCTALLGVDVPQRTIFPTSVGAESAIITGNGPQKWHTAQVSIFPKVTDGGTQSCKVFERKGNE